VGRAAAATLKTLCRHVLIRRAWQKRADAVEAQFDLIAIAVDHDTVTMLVERVAKF